MSESLSKPTPDLVGAYIDRSEQLQKIAQEEAFSDRLIYAYDDRRRLAGQMLADDQAVMQLAERRPQLIDQFEMDLSVDSVLKAAENPQSQTAQDAKEMVFKNVVPETAQEGFMMAGSAFQEALKSPSTAEDAMAARAMLNMTGQDLAERSTELYDYARTNPQGGRAVLALFYEQEQISPATLSGQKKNLDEWLDLQSKTENAAREKDGASLENFREQRLLVAEKNTDDVRGLVGHAILTPPDDTSLTQKKSELFESDAQEMRHLRGQGQLSLDGPKTFLNNALQVDLGDKSQDPVARYIWLKERSFAIEAGSGSAQMGSLVRSMVQEEVSLINGNRAAHLTSLSRIYGTEGDKKWIKSAVSQDIKNLHKPIPDPLENLPAPAPSATAPTRSVEEEHSVGPRPVGKTPDLGSAVSNSSPALPSAAPQQTTSDDVHIDRTAGGFGQYNAKAFAKEDGSIGGRVAQNTAMTDRKLKDLLSNPDTPAFALPLSRYSMNGTIDREFKAIWKQQPERLVSLLEGNTNLMHAIKKKERPSEDDLEAYDKIQIGTRALGAFLIKQDRQRFEEKVEGQLAPLRSQQGAMMSPEVVRDLPNGKDRNGRNIGLIQSGHHEKFAENLQAARGSSPLAAGLGRNLSNIGRNLNQHLGSGLLNRIIDDTIR